MRNRVKILQGVLLLVLLSVGLGACRKPVGQLPKDEEALSKAFMEGYKGFYVLNNGGKGSNKATLDYFDAAEGIYHRNIYAQQNPQNPAMGDDATDMAYYDGYLYVALRGSHKVVKLDPTGKYVGEMRVNECDKLMFYEGMGYVTSLRKENIPLDQPPYGEVIRFDPASLQIEERGLVGCQPASMLVGGKVKRLYVSNSGSRRVEGYDNTVSAVDLVSLDVIETYQVGVNPSKLAIDGLGVYLITLALGDYASVPANVAKIQLADGKPGLAQKDNKELMKLHPIDMQMAANGDVYCLDVAEVKESGWNGAPRLYSFGSTFTNAVVEALPASALAEIQNAVGFTIHPKGEAYYIYDARNFTSSGTIYCYSKTARKLEWKVRAGIQPVDLEFVKE